MELALAANEKQVGDAMNGMNDAVLMSNLSFGNKPPVSMVNVDNTSLASCRDLAITRKSAASWMAANGAPNKGICAIVDDQPEAERQPVWAQGAGSDRGVKQPWTGVMSVAIIPYSRNDVMTAAVAALNT